MAKTSRTFQVLKASSPTSTLKVVPGVFHVLCPARQNVIGHHTAQTVWNYGDFSAIGFKVRIALNKHLIEPVKFFLQSLPDFHSREKTNALLLNLNIAVSRKKKNVLVLFKMWRLKEAKSHKVSSILSYPQKMNEINVRPLSHQLFNLGKTFSLKIERKWKYPLKLSLLYAVKVLPEEWTCVVHDVHCCKIENKKKMLRKKGEKTGLPDHQNA